MEKLSDLFTYRNSSEEWNEQKHMLNKSIDKALKRKDASINTLLIMKDLLNSSCNSMQEYYKE